MPLLEVQEEVLSASVSNKTNSTDLNKSSAKESGERSKFGPQPQFNSPDFDFQKELD